MQSDAPAKITMGEGPRDCPTCGTPYPEGSADTGCPVCLFRRTLDLESETKINAPGDGLSPDDGDGFDHYELARREDGSLDELGRGAMGITYRAFDTVLGHAVALKVLDAHIAADPAAQARFLREARAAARLRHPNIASVFYYGVRPSDGQCFYAMELIEGETLQARLRREGPLPLPVALEITRQVTRALAAADAQGLVHRDLKPSNLMLAKGPEFSVRIIDFGLAKAVAAAEESDLTHGGFVGTPVFASPEQFTSGGVDVRADLYSLGVTLWEMLTGEAPFQGSRAALMQQHLRAPLPLDQLKGVPQPVCLLLQTLLEKDPARRLQTPDDLLQALPKITGAIEAGRSLARHDLHRAPSADRAAVAAVTRRPPPRRGPKKISIARLPVTGREMFGREEDLAFLEAAWADPHVNAVTVVAWAGVGKSTLVNHWLRRMAAERYRSAEVVFGWSFYRQGTSGDASSADEFVDAALAWFGDRDPRLGSAWEKGERLAGLIAQRRTLLVLDGLEPLQNPPGSQEGRLRDPALQALLRDLAAFNRGLCVITTRLPVADIADHEGISALRRNLDYLSDEAGAQLLRAVGVKGPEAELRQASDEFRGHCLALTLLGSYLTDAYNGEIRCRDEVSNRLAHDVRQGAHARKVMASYQGWFGEGAELSVLRLLGLFDRPADAKALEAVQKPPAMPGLTEGLSDLSPTEWRTILAKLRRARLLAEEDPHRPGHLDTHPLVREYFGDQLRTQHIEAWREGNRRLYLHYQTLAPPLPDTFRDMEPLFLAVTCGCQAGLMRDALHQIYLPRIQRGATAFAANVLGARGASLSVLAQFFEQGHWGSPVATGVEGQSLTAEDELFILMQAGLLLTATRGLQAPEARICYERAESLCHSLHRPMQLNSALLGQWLSSLITDKLTETMQIAKRVYALAQKQNDPVLMLGAQRALAGTFYYMGDFEAAREHAMHAIQIWRSGAVASPVEELHSPAVVSMVYKALCDWCFGETASCRATMAQAIDLARELKNTTALAAGLYFAAALGHLERDPAEVERFASDLMELTAHNRLGFWPAGGMILRGWARSASGDIAEGIAWIEEGIRAYRATGVKLTMPYLLTLKAEALHLAGHSAGALEAIEEADVAVDAFEERWWCAELHRLRGLFLATLGADEARITASFCNAVQIAKRQRSIPLMNRAEATYAEYRSRKGRKHPVFTPSDVLTCHLPRRSPGGEW
ncbi:MAG: protein kinase [Verrucomicrobia bacterium]|nr:protein kinase [Verrucomicrobiota bacterium]